MIIFNKKTDSKIMTYSSIFMLIAFVAAIIFDSNRTSLKYEDCIDIEYNMEENFVVVSFDKVKGGCYVSSDTLCFMIPSSANYSYHYKYIQDNIFPGDSISKHFDTIYVFSQTRGDLYFILGAHINEK